MNHRLLHPTPRIILLGSAVLLTVSISGVHAADHAGGIPNAPAIVAPPAAVREFIVEIQAPLAALPEAMRGANTVSFELPHNTRPRSLNPGRGVRVRYLGGNLVRLTFPASSDESVELELVGQQLHVRIGGAADATSPTSPNANPPGSPPAETPDESKPPAKPPVAAEKSRLDLAKLDLAVPASPAFTVLGITPDQVVRPDSPRELALALLNGFDDRGNFQSGLSIDTVPYLLTHGPRLTLTEYRKSRVAQILSRTKFSLATAKGAEGDDPSIKLGLGLQTTLWDRGDPRLDKKLTDEIDDITLEYSEKKAKEDGEISSRKLTETEKKAIIEARTAELRKALLPKWEAARNRNWNRSSWTLGLAPSLLSKSGSTDDFRWNGGGIWTSLAYGFEETPGLKDSSQLILHLRYRDNELVPTGKKKNPFQSEDSFLVATQLRMGKPDLNFLLTAAYLDSRAAGSNHSLFRVALGLEHRIATDMWVNLSVGQNLNGTSNDNGTFVFGSIKFGASSKSRFGAVPAIP